MSRAGAFASLWASMPPALRVANPQLAPSPLARHAAAGAPEHAAEIEAAHDARRRHSATSRTAQAEGAAFEDWVDSQHAYALAAGWLSWVDHYGPAVRHLADGSVRVVGKAPPDYLGQLAGGRTLLVEAKRRTGRLEMEGDDRAAIRPHQATRLALAEAGGGAALVLVEFIRADGVTRCAAPWSAVVAAARSPRGGPRSVGPEDLTPWLAATPCYLAPFVEEVSRVR